MYSITWVFFLNLKILHLCVRFLWQSYNWYLLWWALNYHNSILQINHNQILMYLWSVVELSLFFRILPKLCLISISRKISVQCRLLLRDDSFFSFGVWWHDFFPYQSSILALVISFVILFCGAAVFDICRLLFSNFSCVYVYFITL